MSESYCLQDVPQADGEASRFFLSSNPAGWGSNPGATFSEAVQSLAGAIKASMDPLAPQAVTVALSHVVLDGQGYHVEARGQISRVPTKVSERPGKVWQKMKAGQLLDSFLLRGSAFEKAPDREVWAAACVAASAMRLDGADLRRMNDYLAIALLARMGIADVTDYDLPHVSQMQKTVSG